jgi:very-short-patch-repair endonuclease
MDRRLLTFARSMRHEPSPAELAMWKLLRGHGLAGFSFRRQHVLEPYIADYYCALAALVVELDGDSHADSEEYDTIRTGLFVERGLKVLRFWNAEVFEDSESVAETIYRECVERVRNNPIVRHRLNEHGQVIAKKRS